MKNFFKETINKISMRDKELIKENIEEKYCNNTNDIIFEEHENIVMINPNELVIDPILSKEFDINEDDLERIKTSMIRKGFDKAEPVVVLKENDRFVIVDGNSRTRASKELNIDLIPISIKKFKDRDEALAYTKFRQINRRNLSDKELLKYVQNMPEKKERDGRKGRSDELVAKELSVSTSKITQTKYVNKNSSKEDLEAINSGEKSTNEIYQKLRAEKKNNSNIKKQEIYNNSERKNKDETIIKEKINMEDILDLLSKHKELNSLKIICEVYKSKFKVCEKYFLVDEENNT